MPRLLAVLAGSEDGFNLTADSVGEVPVAGGVEVLLRLWKIVPMVVDVLINGWLVDKVSERMDTFELPRTRVGY